MKIARLADPNGVHDFDIKGAMVFGCNVEYCNQSNGALMNSVLKRCEKKGLSFSQVLLEWSLVNFEPTGFEIIETE